MAETTHQSDSIASTDTSDKAIAALLKAGQAAEAVPLLERRIEAAPKDFQLRLRYARALASAGQKVEAKHAAEAADELDKLDLDEMQQLMKLHRELGALHRVERLAKIILSDAPGLLSVREELIKNHIHRRELHAARFQLETAQALDGVTADQLTAISNYYVNIGRILNKMHPHHRSAEVPPVLDAQMALVPANKAIRLAPDNAVARLAIITAYLDLGLPKEAERHLVRVTDETLSPAQQIILATSLAKIGRHVESATISEKILARSGCSKRDAISAARILMEIGRISTAANIILSFKIDTFRSIQELTDLFELCDQLDLEDQARAAVNRVLELDPYHPLMSQKARLFTLVDRHKNTSHTVEKLHPDRGLFVFLKEKLGF